jgi:threonine/homoserine/homoserine lactone efflux protein
MGIVFTATSVITLKAKKSLMNKITQHSIWINRAMGSILVIAGLYIAYISLPLI